MSDSLKTPTDQTKSSASETPADSPAPQRITEAAKNLSSNDKAAESGGNQTVSVTAGAGAQISGKAATAEGATDSGATKSPATGPQANLEETASKAAPSGTASATTDAEVQKADETQARAALTQSDNKPAAEPATGRGPEGGGDSGIGSRPGGISGSVRESGEEQKTKERSSAPQSLATASKAASKQKEEARSAAPQPAALAQQESALSPERRENEEPKKRKILFDYKDPLSLYPLLEGWKIPPSGASGLSRAQQKQLRLAVKKARALGLLPSHNQAYDDFERPAPVSLKPFEC